jgi:hypothetical protein
MILFRDTAYDKVIKHVGTGLPYAADVVLFSAPDIKMYMMAQEAHFLQREGYSDIAHQHLGLDNARTNTDDLYKKIEEAHGEGAKPC